MTFELKGAYAMLLDLIYMCGGELYDEPRFIAGHMNCSVRAWGNYRAALIERLRRAIAEWTGDAPADDDRTIVVIRRLPA